MRDPGGNGRNPAAVIRLGDADYQPLMRRDGCITCEHVVIKILGRGTKYARCRLLRAQVAPFGICNLHRR